MNRKQLRWPLAAMCALLLAACAQSNGDISRVQPNVLKKTDLLGAQWYFRNTVTSTPASTGFTFRGETGNMEKLVFEVTETSLIGYRAYPFMPGSETNVDPASIPSGSTTRFCDTTGKCAEPQQFFGAPVVAYPILSHFDIQRSYSTATGEQTNVIVENSSDRPWNEREYMRVDWSANTANAGTSMLWNTVQNPSGASTVSAWIQPNEPGTDPYDWPLREYKPGADGENVLSYFDFTGRYFVKPTTMTYGIYQIPNCMLFGGERYDCTSQQINMRTSLARVDTNRSNNYEPLQYSNEAQGKFGYFRTERLTYDRKHGVTESGRLLLGNRYRIWKESYAKNADGSPDKARPLPYAQREVNPIVYYLSPATRMGTPEIYKQYMEAARVLERNWDVAFRRAVAAARQQPSVTEQVLFICESPVPAQDTLTGQPPPAACGPVGFEPRMGDLRYSFLNTITEPVPNGLLGYGPSSVDVETGEIISANANVYTGAVDSSAQGLLTRMDFLVGDKSVDDIIAGTDVRNYILSNPAYSSTLKQKSGLIQSELQGEAVQLTDAPTVGAFDRPTALMANTMLKYRATGLPTTQLSSVSSAAAKLSQLPALEASVLDNPELEADAMAMLPPALEQLATNDPSLARDLKRDVLLKFPELRSRMSQARVAWANKNSVTLVDFVDQTLVGVAHAELNKRTARMNALQSVPHCDPTATTGQAICTAEQKALIEDIRKYCGTACSAAQARAVADQEIRRRFQQSVWRATAEHEIGHTFGLMHNFQGSFDAVNFNDQYWDIKKASLSVVQNGTAKVPRTPTDLKNLSDGTEDQLIRGLHDYEYSSIMDYGGKINGDWKGVGKYDEAAIVFAYSGGTEPGYVEVFNGARRSTLSFPGSDGQNFAVTGAGHDLPVVNAARTANTVPNYVERFHYSTVPLHFGDGANLADVTTDGIAKLKSRRLMKWSDVKAATAALREKVKAGVAVTDADTQSMPLEVPYMYCSDYEEGKLLSCNMWDRGPDYFEMTKTWLESYWNNYYFTHFKRDRYSFSSDSATNDAYGTFLSTGAVYKHWVHAMYGRGTTSSQTFGDYRTGPFGYDALMQDTWTMAALDGINNLLRVMSVPPAGYYMYRTRDPNGDTVPRWEVVSEGDDFDTLNESGRSVLKDYYSNNSNYSATQFAVLPRGEARRMYSRYDYKSGAGFFRRMLEAGHYNDQFGAMFAAVSPDAQFLGVDNYADQNRYYIPYYLVFGRELGDMFGALWSMDEPKVRPTMYFTRNNGGAVTTTPALQFQTKVAGSTYINNFQYPKPDVINFTGTFDAPANIQLTWTSRIYALYLGMALFSVNYDVDYAKQNQVYKVGGAEQITVAPGYHTMEVQDVTTGAIYAAIEKDGATPAQRTPALRMINQARNLLTVVNNPKLALPQEEWDNPARVEAKRKEYTELFRDSVRDLDLMRGMYSLYGHPF